MSESLRRRLVAVFIVVRTHTDAEHTEQHKGSRSDTYTSSVSPQACWAPASAEGRRQTEREDQCYLHTRIFTFRAEQLQKEDFVISITNQKSLLAFALGNVAQDLPCIHLAHLDIHSNSSQHKVFETTARR